MRTWNVLCKFSCVACLLGAALAPAAPVKLSIVSPASATQGDAFQISVNISGASGLYDFQFDLTFDPTKLSGTGSSEGNFLSSGGNTLFLAGTIDNATGNITATADTLLGPGSGVSGGGTLSTFDFTAIATGTSALQISNVILQDSHGYFITGNESPGQIVINAPVITPEPGATLLVGGLLCWIAFRKRLS